MIRHPWSTTFQSDCSSGGQLWPSRSTVLQSLAPNLIKHTACLQVILVGLFRCFWLWMGLNSAGQWTLRARVVHPWFLGLGSVFILYLIIRYFILYPGPTKYADPRTFPTVCKSVSHQYTCLMWWLCFCKVELVYGSFYWCWNILVKQSPNNSFLQ